MDKPPETAPPPEQAVVIENSASAMPRTAVPFDISTIIIPEGINNSGDEMEMVDAVDQFNISELHIPKTKVTGKNRGKKAKKAFKQKYISINPDWGEMSTRLKTKSAENKKRGKSALASGTI